MLIVPDKRIGNTYGTVYSQKFGFFLDFVKPLAVFFIGFCASTYRKSLDLFFFKHVRHPMRRSLEMDCHIRFLETLFVLLKTSTCFYICNYFASIFCKQGSHTVHT
jgi:hypothetical protein